MVLNSLLLFCILCATTLGAPVTESNDDTYLVERNTAANPIDASFDITGWEDIAEENCFAMLCLQNANRVYQRVATQGARGRNYRGSGAAFTPFQAPQLASRHTSQINSNTISAEEFPWQSMQEGGPNAYVFPATIAQQDAQRDALNTGYRTSRVAYNDSFRITFTGGTFGQYCTALFANPPDTSVCTTEPTQTLFGTAAVNIANYAYRIVRSGAVPFAFQHVAGVNKGKITKRLEDSDVMVIEETSDVEAKEGPF